jgi:hypothetical protein
MAKYSYAQLEEIWVAGATRRGYSKAEAISQAPLMAAISLAESKGESEAVGHYPDATPEGLWQINGKPFDGNALNPVTNAEMAATKLKSQGLGAWETYTNGDYKTYYTEKNVKEASTKAKLDQASFLNEALEDATPGGLGEKLGQETGEGLAKGTLIKEAEGTIKEGEQAAKAVTSTAEFLEALSEPETWIRVAETLGGLLLLYIAIRQMSGRFEVSRTVVAQTRKGADITTRTGRVTAKHGKEITKAPERVAAGRKAHVRSKKFGGTGKQAVKAAIKAAVEAPK